MPKRLRQPKKKVDPEDTDAATVYPDIVVHKRGEQQNLLVIEAKKSNRNNELLDDALKIQEFMRPYSEGGFGYAYGAVIVFTTGRTPGARTERWFASPELSSNHHGGLK